MPCCKNPSIVFLLETEKDGPIWKKCQNCQFESIENVDNARLHEIMKMPTTHLEEREHLVKVQLLKLSDLRQQLFEIQIVLAKRANFAAQNRNE